MLHQCSLLIGRTVALMNVWVWDVSSLSANELQALGSTSLPITDTMYLSGLNISANTWRIGGAGTKLRDECSSLYDDETARGCFG